jgi:hypothetical protein
MLLWRFYGAPLFLRQAARASFEGFLQILSTDIVGQCLNKIGQYACIAVKRKAAPPAASRAAIVCQCRFNVSPECSAQ